MTPSTDDRGALFFEPSRACGLDRLAAFQPAMGVKYAAERNSDYGPHERDNVSCLSPWVRTRLLTEKELAEAALCQFRYDHAEKFHQEVCWRTYFKGWLEHHPSVWTRYQETLLEDLSALEQNSGLQTAYDHAVSGNTGIEGFDDWAVELRETGYLHNHARMWFASIWLFILKLPWTLGADFFLRHLLDGDAASNTLSWRWVGGLHTPGKTYLARTSNIEKYTNGRFAPTHLADQAEPIVGFSNPSAQAFRKGDDIAAEDAGLLLTEDDLGVHSLPYGGAGIKGVAGAVFPDARSPLGCAANPKSFAEGALSDALDRASEIYQCPHQKLSSDGFTTQAIDWARGLNVSQILTGMPPIGWVRPQLDRLQTGLAEHDIRLVYVQRDWDRLFWPHASKGFFKLKKVIPDVYEELGLL